MFPIIQSGGIGTKNCGVILQVAPLRSRQPPTPNYEIALMRDAAWLMHYARERYTFPLPSQKRIVAAGGTALATVFLAATCYFLFVLLREFVTQFKDVLLPLAIAAILATLLRPIITICENKTRLNRVGGIILLFALVLMTLLAIAVFVVPPALENAGDFLKAAPGMLTRLLESIKALPPQFGNGLQSN